MNFHEEKILQLQEQIRNHYLQKDSLKAPLAINYSSKNSFTTRTKKYKSGCRTIDCGPFNQIIAVDPVRQIAIVQPRVKMEALLQATLRHRLVPPVLPELRDMTIGGAIMGIAGESGSFRWGTFNDICQAFEILCGDGTLLKVDKETHPDLFYGIPGSYGSLGMLISAEIKLIPAKDGVRLRYHLFSNPHDAIEAILSLSHDPQPPDFLDGIIFDKEHCVVIEGHLEYKKNISHFPLFSTKPFHSEMYYRHVKKIENANDEEFMTHDDYFFRYDLGAFWIGNYVYHFPLLAELILEGYLNSNKGNRCFTQQEIERYRQFSGSNAVWRTVMRPFSTSRYLSKKLHKAERWVQNRFMIQDFCVPEKQAYRFLDVILDDPGIFPIWLLPIKGTKAPQIFAPHVLKGNEESHLLNFGLYGIPAYSSPLRDMTRILEQKTMELDGRKVLYSRSYYSQGEFWDIYSQEAYDKLRAQTASKGVWHGIEEKVLSE